MGRGQASKTAVKRAMFRIAPKTATAIVSARGRAFAHRKLVEWGLHEVDRKLLAAVGDRVLRGPFAGMRLTPATHDAHIGPSLLGTYERELHPWWEQLLTSPVGPAGFEQVVDIGSSFGYYAVGLALKMPRAHVIAFDTDWWARRATREMAAGNDAGNVRVAGFCDAGWIARNVRGNALIVSDCEGYEDQLFTDATLPALRRATLVIELHDQIAPGVTSRLKARFAPTHESCVMKSVDPLTPAELEALRVPALTQDELRAAAGENRGPQDWLLLRPR